MQELLLLRHAEALAASATVDDAARGLSPRGENDARQAGMWLKQHQGRPDLVLCSPAQRTRDTTAQVLDIIGPAPVCEPADIYAASAGQLMALLEREPCGGHARVMLVGHNPAIGQLLGVLLEGHAQTPRSMPPAGLAWIELERGRPEPGSGHLRAFWSPA